MKSTFTLLLVIFTLLLKAQTPLCYVFHGCGGATVVAINTDPTWNSISYDFQRLLGGNWVTVHQSVENFHIVIPGDILVATQYRAILRNDITTEERISTGVTVDPAKFFDAVIKPSPIATFYWGTAITGGANYVEVIPGNIALNGMRPPFTYSIKKKNSFVFDQKFSTRGIFFTIDIVPNQEYVITVKDYCGQVDSIEGAFGLDAFGRVTDRNCSGASIELVSVTDGQNFSFRQPVTFALEPLADSIPANNVPESILAGLTYNYSAGIITGLTENRYLVRAKDAFGVLSSYSVVTTGIVADMPQLVSWGPSGGFCNLFVTLAGSQPESGIRLAGSNEAYTFTSGQTISNFKAGKTYEIVTRDNCGRLSVPLVQTFEVWPPVITSVNVAEEGCKKQLTVIAQTCSDAPEYRLKITGGDPGEWQSSNIFEYESITGCDTIYVRDGEGLNIAEAFQSVCFDLLQLNATTYPQDSYCGAPYEIHADAFFGVPPYNYAISSDGVNFSANTGNPFFSPLSPGTYTVRVTDACGKTAFTALEDGVAGATYEVMESGFTGSCGTAGGYLHILIEESINAQVVSPPYKYEVKEIIGGTGNNIQYGNVISNGTTTNLDFTISGLPGNKRYGVFIANDCDEPFTPKNRAANDYAIPGCNEFVTVWDLATAGGPNTELTFGVATGGTVNYTWETIPSGTSGSGTFTGSTATITGLPADATIRLYIQPTNFERIIIHRGTDRNRLSQVENWGSTAWTSMEFAFFGCENLQITATDVPDLSGVSSMFQMFQQCTALNSPANIDTWNTASITNMSLMFAEASAFDQNIGTWNTTAVMDMRGMFEGASAFNQNISSWNTATVTDMGYMFARTSAFNQDISSWNTAAVTNMSAMFSGASAFNQNIGNWNTAAVTDMSFMFRWTSSFDQNIGSWNTAAVTNMSAVFYGASAFNQNIGTWNTAAVTDMSYMFGWTSAFNQNIGNWNTAAVTNMSWMFNRASAFNQNIGSWNTAAVTDMSYMFWSANTFNQNIGTWALNPGVLMENMLDNCGMDCSNYSATLTGWSANPATPANRSLGATGMQYGTNALAARTNLTGAKGWTITDDALGNGDCGPMAIWTGAVNTNWHEPGNWVGNVVPTAGSVVSIPLTPNKPVIQQDADCLNLTIESGATVTINPQHSLTVFGVLSNNTVNGLVIESDAIGTGSLIAATATGTGTAEVQRYMTGNQWHNVSSPVQQSVASFLSNNANIPTKESSRGITDYNSTTDTWNAYFTNNTAGNLETAKGYLLRNDANGIVKFNGAIHAGTQSIALSPAGLGWNLIGNPFTSAIKVNTAAGINSFLAVNASILDPSYVSIYVWNGAQYEIINNASNAEFATVGQGFFVKSTIGATAGFTPEMQVHQPTVQLKSGTVIPEIKLFVSSAGKNASTSIKFIEGTTAGLDKGYDAGILKADPLFSVYTKLVNNNVEFGLQCLPLTNIETIAVPVGIDFSAGGEVTFSAQLFHLPSEYKIVLEDRLLNVFTSFNSENSAYKTTLAANSKGAGRFYLNVSDAQVTSIWNETKLNKIAAWLERDEIVINGIAENKAVATLYDLRGSSVLVRNLEKTITNRINVTGLTTGIYMLQVIENGKRTGIKLPITGN